MTKKWYLSRTLWINTGLAAIAALTLFADVFTLTDGEAKIIVFLIGLVNILLRFITKTELSK